MFCISEWLQLLHGRRSCDSNSSVGVQAALPAPRLLHICYIIHTFMEKLTQKHIQIILNYFTFFKLYVIHSHFPFVCLCDASMFAVLVGLLNNRRRWSDFQQYFSRNIKIIWVKLQKELSTAHFWDSRLQWAVGCLKVNSKALFLKRCCGVPNIIMPVVLCGASKNIFFSKCSSMKKHYWCSRCEVLDCST